MFDKLVESTNQKQKGRSKFYLVTCLIYGTSLSVLAVATILWFNPAMAEANTVVRLLTPPAQPAPPPPLDAVQPAPATPEIFVSPVKIPDKIADPTKVPPKPPTVSPRILVAGAPNIGDSSVGGNGSSPVGPGNGNEVESPPPPPPTPKVEPTPTPTPKTPDIVRMPSTMITGKAIRKIQPPYPQIARAIKAQGTVPVQIMISEEGRVLSATAVGGHPTLQPAAQQAAMQWVFSPTVLNGRAVKVAGVISFNFILN